MCSLVLFSPWRCHVAAAAAAAFNVAAAAGGGGGGGDAGRGCQGVALLPFIDEERLVGATNLLLDQLSEEETYRWALPCVGCSGGWGGGGQRDR